MSLGISFDDGVIHLIWDLHNTPLNYRCSREGLALHPEQHDWTVEMFGGVERTLPGLVGAGTPMSEEVSSFAGSGSEQGSMDVVIVDVPPPPFRPSSPKAEECSSTSGRGLRGWGTSICITFEVGGRRPGVYTSRVWEAIRELSLPPFPPFSTCRRPRIAQPLLNISSFAPARITAVAGWRLQLRDKRLDESSELAQMSRMG